MTYTKVCRVHGGEFEANKETTVICRSCWYETEMVTATAQYQPLIDAIKAQTGLDSEVWQSGGMTMTLWTRFSADPDIGPYDGRRYWTLVEGWDDDGKLQGSTGYYLPTAEDEATTDVVIAYGGTDHNYGPPLTADEWADKIAAHFKTIPEVLRECLASGEHLASCDDDGYCSRCGHQL